MVMTIKKDFWNDFKKKSEKKRILHVLRKGVKERNCSLKLIYYVPNSNLNPELEELWNYIKMYSGVESHMQLLNNYSDNVDFQEHLLRVVDKMVDKILKEKL